MYNYNQLNQSLIKGYISEYAESKLEFLPEFITNDSKTHKRVLTTIINELNNCDEFWFSVAFVTTSGVASLINTLIELKDIGTNPKNLLGTLFAITSPSNILCCKEQNSVTCLMICEFNALIRIVLDQIDIYTDDDIFEDIQYEQLSLITSLYLSISLSHKSLA